MKKKLFIAMATLTLTSSAFANECKTDNWVEESQFHLSNTMREVLFFELANSLAQDRTAEQKKKVDGRIKSIEEISTLPKKCYKQASIVELKLLNNA